ncbi:MAG TPA: hypothetical protein VFQ13_07765 [Anaerolineales bacterium]|nr:hypothetical protein [Anaerolineales bacterium]
MKKLFSIFQTSRILLLFSLVFSSACQPAQAPASPTPFPTLPPAKSTPTGTILFSLPTPTASPTATAQPTASEVPIPLSQEGPWLVYTGQVHDSQGAIVNGQIMVNQDGTGRTPIPFDCYPGDTREGPSNRLITFSNPLYRTIYLFDPTRGTWALVHRTWPGCGSEYTGDNENGLLATMVRGEGEDIPELLIYELPGGKIRDRFPILFKCPEGDQACDTSNVEWWNFEMAWSPSGRYLAFAATLENQPSEFGPSSDLYLYDVRTGKIIRLTSGPDSVAQIWWSPDGKWIIMGELHESNYPFTTSVWAVSAAGGEMRKLYSIDRYPQGILGWLDNSRFIVYSGTSLYDATDLPAYNLEVVDIDTGELTSLFKGSFFGAALDREDETVAVAVYLTELRPGYEAGQGIYLFSTSNTTPRYVGSDELQSNWNDELKLFVTHKPCESDPEGTVAFDVNGKLQCLHSSLPDNYPSPDGKWQVSIETGVWLETNGKQPVQILEGKATQVIWRLDSAGFFLLAEGTPGSEQNLYYVSLPEASLNLINRYVYGPVEYQWLEK